MTTLFSPRFYLRNIRGGVRFRFGVISLLHSDSRKGVSQFSVRAIASNLTLPCVIFALYEPTKRAKREFAVPDSFATKLKWFSAHRTQRGLCNLARKREVRLAAHSVATKSAQWQLPPARAPSPPRKSGP